MNKDKPTNNTPAEATKIDVCKLLLTFEKI